MSKTTRSASPCSPMKLTPVVAGTSMTVWRKKYSFGDDVAALNDYGWHTGNAAGNDPPVGAKKANPWGLHDVHGYLWEWCSDVWGDDVATLPPDGTPRAQGDAKFGVLRSGSWKDTGDKLTSGYRLRVDRTIRDDAVGLRCVLTP